MYFISYGTKYVDGSASFRIPWALQSIPALLLLACIPFLPRSPRWLASKDRWDEAIDVLANLHAKGNKRDPLIITEIREIKEKIELERHSKSRSWAELFRPKNIIRVHCAIFAHIWSQFSGTNAMMYYIVYIFQMAGLSGNFSKYSRKPAHIKSKTLLRVTRDLVSIDRHRYSGVLRTSFVSIAPGFPDTSVRVLTEPSPHRSLHPVRDQCCHDFACSDFHGQMASPEGHDDWLLHHGDVAFHRSWPDGLIRARSTRRSQWRK